MCSPKALFFFFLPSPERHWRFVTRSIERKRPSAPTRERSPPRTEPGTTADVHAADTHAHTHRNTHTHNRKKEALALRFGRHRDREVCSETTQSTARRLGEAHSSDTTVPTNTARLTGSIVLDVCFPRRISRRACRC